MMFNEPIYILLFDWNTWPKHGYHVVKNMDEDGTFHVGSLMGNLTKRFIHGEMSQWDLPKKTNIPRRYKRYIQLDGINDMTPQWYYWLGVRRTRHRCVSTCSGLSLLSTTTRGCRGPLPVGHWPPMEDDFWFVSGRINRDLAWVTVVCNYIQNGLTP